MREDWCPGIHDDVVQQRDDGSGNSSSSSSDSDNDNNSSSDDNNISDDDDYESIRSTNASRSTRIIVGAIGSTTLETRFKRCVNRCLLKWFSQKAALAPNCIESVSLSTKRFERETTPIGGTTVLEFELQILSRTVESDELIDSIQQMMRTRFNAKESEYTADLTYLLIEMLPGFENVIVSQRDRMMVPSFRDGTVFINATDSISFKLREEVDDFLC